MPNTQIDASPSRATLRRPRAVERPFYGLIDPVVVPDPAVFVFDGSISHEHAFAAWVWIARDIAPDLLDRERQVDEAEGRQQLALDLPDILSRVRFAYQAATEDVERLRRARVQVGGEEVWDRLPHVMTALRSPVLLEKAQSFGRAANGMADEAALGLALQSMPQTEPILTAMMFHAAIGQVAQPSRLVSAVIRIANGATDQAVQRAGFTPLIDGILAHAQAQIPVIGQSGAFADMDQTCRAIDRYHKLMRAVTGFIELTRMSRWATLAASMTKTVSEQIEPKLVHVMSDINLAMRRREGGTDRFDSDLILSALNGCYLLATVRECRDSLAVNSTFEQTWAQVGQALEVHVQRYLELYKQNPHDRIVAARLDAVIKMAELRFTADYADVLRRARDVAERRIS